MTTLTVLGAGVAGLAAGHVARECGCDATIYEAGARAGGLLDGITVQGFRFDNAVHLSFADRPEVREIFDRTPYVTHKTDVRCYEAGRWLKHPVQNNLYPLPVEERLQLIEGFVQRPSPDIQNYRDWLVYQYGEPLAERYPARYTRKYWTLPPEALGTEWIGPRMRRAELREVLHGALTDQTPNYFYTNEMRYPREGGYRAFIEPLLAGADIRCDHRLVRIDPAAHTLHFQNGHTANYLKLISTLPLPELVRLSSAPDGVQSAASSLIATSVDLISVGVARPEAFSDLWFYIYDEEILAARAYSPSVKSADNCPSGCSSLQFEIYSSPRQPQTRSVHELKDNCTWALGQMNLAEPGEILFLHHKHVRYANVIFDLGMEKRREIVRKWLSQAGIVGAGRFGEWDYLWSHQAFESGVRAARHSIGAI